MERKKYLRETPKAKTGLTGTTGEARERGVREDGSGAWVTQQETYGSLKGRKVWRQVTVSGAEWVYIPTQSNSQPSKFPRGLCLILIAILGRK